MKPLIWHNCYDGSWRDLIVSHAFAHPAKFAPSLVRRIYAHGLKAGWWKRGDLIGDPFGGIAGGGIMAGYAGLNWIGVELEPRFVAMGNQNLAMHGPKWAALEEATSLKLIQGDSRRFAEIVGQAAAVVTSPPYEESLAFVNDKKAASIKRAQIKYDRFHGKTSSEFYEMTPGAAGMGGDYGSTEGQIGSLPGGDLDAVLTSPPYAETLNHGGGPDTHEDKRRGQSLLGIKEGYGTTTGQIGKCGEGSVDAVVTSPPWEKGAEGAVRKEKFRDPVAFASAMTAADGKGSRNSTSLKSRLAQMERDASKVYGTSKGQIGQDAGETYWQAMNAVYSQCLLALKPDGVMAVVVKDYVKDKQRVPLCDQTLRLLEHIGFQSVCRIHAMLVKEQTHAGLFHDHVERRERKSFFRRLAEKKGSPRIDYEEVIVVRKVGAA